MIKRKVRILVTSDTHEDFETGWSSPEGMDRWWKEVADQKPELVLHAGDWACTAEGIGEAMKRATRFVKCPFLTVPGNHDFWMDGGPELALAQFRNSCILAGIHDVSYERFVYRDLTIVGWIWWYEEEKPPTNDAYWMGDFFKNRPIHEYMRQMSTSSLGQAIQHSTGNDRLIIVGHSTLPKNRASNLLNMLRPEMVVEGHWHTHKLNTKIDGTLHVNAGSDYGSPRFVVVEV